MLKFTDKSKCLGIRLVLIKSFLLHSKHWTKLKKYATVQTFYLTGFKSVRTEYSSNRNKYL